MEQDKLTKKLYQENINWVYSIIKELDKNGVECKETFIKDPYIFNNMIVLGYYFMNLYVVSNIDFYQEEDVNFIMMSIVRGASSYNQKKLSSVYHQELSLQKLVDQYNTIVNKTKAYAPNDGLKARVVAVDEVYRRIYKVFNKRHFNVFIKVFMASFGDYEESIKKAIDDYIKNK